MKNVLRGGAPFTLPQIRKQLGMSQDGLATLLEVSTDTIQAWENGRKKPSSTSRLLLEMLAADQKNTIRLIKKSAGFFFQPNPK